MTIQEIYLSARQLPPRERLQLAALILDELTRNDEAIDASDSWSAQDERDATAFSMSHAANLYTEADDNLI